MHDLLMVYTCDDEWLIKSTAMPTVIPRGLRDLKVNLNKDDLTCKF